MFWTGLIIGVFVSTILIFLVLCLCKTSARADLEYEILILKNRIYNLLLEQKVFHNIIKECNN